MRRITLSLAAMVWLAAATAQAQYDHEPRRAGYLDGPASNAAGRVDTDPAEPPVPSGTMPAQYDAPADAPRGTVSPASAERPAAFQRVTEPETSESSRSESTASKSSASDRYPSERYESDRYATDRYESEPSVLELPTTASPVSQARAPQDATAERPRAEVPASLNTAPRVKLASGDGSSSSNASASNASSPSVASGAAASESAPPLPLAASSAPALELPAQAAEKDAPRLNRGAPSIASVIGSLAVVLGLLLLGAWAIKRAMPKAAGSLPPGVVEVLGRAPLAPRQFVHLVRVGNKLLLVSVTPAGAETLTEITDPLEVDRLAGMCIAGQPNSSSQAFRQVFQQFARQPTETSFIEARRRDRRPLGGTDV